MEKRPKSAVHYRSAQRERRCGGCLHFHPGPSGEGACEPVDGPISPIMCCDLWRPLKHGARRAGDPSHGAGR